MPKVVHNLRRFFRRTDASHEVAPFKQAHFLNTLSPSFLVDLLVAAEQKRFYSLAPDLKDQKVLFYSTHAVPVHRQEIRSRVPDCIVEFPLRPAIVPDAGMPQTSLFLRGELPSPPLRPQAMDVVLAPLAGEFQSGWADRLRELTDPLAHHGRCLFSFVHPLVEIFLYNQNPASMGMARMNIEKYVEQFRQAQLYLETIGEAVVDEELKPFFVASGDDRRYEEFRGIPLVLFFRCIKYVKGN